MDGVTHRLSLFRAAEASRAVAPRSPFREQRPPVYFPGLETHTVWRDDLRHGVVERFDAEAAAREVVRALADDVRFLRVPDVRTRGTWACLPLACGPNFYQENLSYFPTLERLIRATPRRVGLACISVLGPSSHIPLHCGNSNIHLRCHFPIRIPPECYMRLAGSRVEWVPGKTLVFDDSFEHEVWNNSSDCRYVLMLDVIHPSLLDEELGPLERYFEVVPPPARGLEGWMKSPA